MTLCNIRTLRAPLSGVQRYVSEMLRQLPEVTQLTPPAWARGPAGHLWEQTLPPRKQLLWSPANTGPLAWRAQVVTVHDLGPFDCPEAFSPAFRAWYVWLWPRLLPRVKGVITVSQFSKRRLIEHFGLPPGRIHVTPLGVDHQHFYPRPKTEIAALRRRLNLPGPFILFTGQFSARKNLAGLLAAWRQSQTAVDKSIQLVLAGGAGAGHVFGGTGLPDLPPRTRLLGRVADADLPTLMSAASLFVFPSHYEGFGLPPLEAMACGTPCLTSNAAALPEVVGEAALTVSSTDTPALATTLTHMMNDTATRTALRRQGLARAAGFPWQRTAALTAGVLKRYE
jgi:glycosyltransferase involved in cell wall biosynthesis